MPDSRQSDGEDYRDPIEYNRHLDDLNEYREQYLIHKEKQESNLVQESNPLVNLDSEGKAVSVVWATPSIDGILGYIARVSNPDNQKNPNVSKLLCSMLNEGHWSPFTMANICLEINTTRDISRQLLRHSSIAPQEFSQRYQDVGKLPKVEPRECRLQDSKNRQASLELTGETDEEQGLARWWEQMQIEVQHNIEDIYTKALAFGIAKEQARVILPEGLTPTRLYMNGNVRSWLTFLMQRLDWTTQKECRDLAWQVADVLETECPIVWEAFKGCNAYKKIRFTR